MATEAKLAAHSDPEHLDDLADAGRAGRKPSVRAFDALIAATAIANQLGVYTCNPKDFEGIDGLAVITVPHPGTTG